MRWTPKSADTTLRTGGVAVMSLVVLLIAMGLVMGAAAHTSLTVFTVAAAAIGLWLLVFAVRERHGRNRG